MTPHGFPLSERWFRLLLNIYPRDFREELGDGLVEAYRERASDAFESSGRRGLFIVWIAALVDSLRNGLGERIHPAVAWRRAGDWGRDLERVQRRLVKKPLFVASVLATLTVGLGAFAVVYTAVDKILLEPLPYRAPGDLYMVWFNQSVDLPHLMVTGPQIVELRKAGGVIADAAGLTFNGATLMAGDERAERVDALLGSENLFDLLGVEPALGRTFRPGDGTGDAERVVVLTDDLWRRLGANRGIVGTTLTLSSKAYTVIAVMPPGFRFSASSSARKPQLYIPFEFGRLAREDPQDSSWLMIVRARAGASEQQVRQGVDAIGRAVVQRDFAKPRGSLEAVGLQRELVNDTRPALITLAFAVVFLMLALAVNLASLLLSRAAERERELAIARALGASGTALVRATLLEGVVLGLAGGVAGSAVGWWGIRVLVAIGPLDLPRRESLAMDPAVASVVVAAGLLLGLAAATVPAAWMARLSLGALMTGAGVRGGAVSARLRRGLIVAQVGVSLVLLTAAGLVVQSFNRLLVADPGFQPNGVLTFSVGVDPWIFPDAGAVTAFQDRAEAVLKSIPGVTAVSAANQLPLSGGRNAASVRVPGAPGNTGDSDRDKQVVSRIFTRAGYVGAVGMRLVSGRDFATRFLPDVHEALIDTHLARRFFPTGDPIGATILVGADRLTVVGVVQQARLFHLDRDDGNPQLYVRVEDHRGWRATDYAVRTTGDPRGLMDPVRTAIHQIEPRVSLANMQTLDEIVADKRSRERISALLIGGLALGALLLVSMGIFGVISGAVLRRRGELAVRLALGATHRRVIGLVVGEGAQLVIAGALIAVPGIYLAGQALREFLVGVSPFDVPTLAAVTMGLAVVALLACYAAARPVATIEPEQLLRDAG